METINCVICSQPIGVDPNGWDGGHNAQPVLDGRCCEPCNAEVVMPTRLKQQQTEGEDRASTE